MTVVRRRYPTDGKAWHELPQTPWSLRHAIGVHVHRDALFIAAGSAVRFTAAEIEKSREDVLHRTESEWLPGDVWRLDRGYSGETKGGARL